MPALNRVHNDKPLTTMSLAKRGATTYIGSKVLKPLDVKFKSDMVYTYGDGTFFTAAPKDGQVLYSMAPGAEYPKIEYDISASTVYYCEQFGLEIPVPYAQLANQDDPLDGLSDASAIVMGNLENAKEQRDAALLFDSSTTFASYTGTPTAQWDTDTADPLKDRNIAVESMMDNGSYNPEVHDLAFIGGIKGWHLYQRNPKIVEAIKAATGALVITEEIWRQYLQVEKFYIGRGTYNTANEGASISLGYIWSGDKCGFYAVPKGKPSTMQACLGATFVWKAGNEGQGDLGWSSRRFPQEKQRRYDVVADHITDEGVTMASCGYVFTNLTSGL